VNPDRKQFERQIEYVQMALYALFMSCFLLIGLLENSKVLTGKVYFGLILIAGAIQFFGSSALNKVSKQMSHFYDSAITIEAPIQGTK
jgi:uncharacterized membrane protein